MATKQTTRWIAAALAAAFLGTTIGDVAMAQSRDRRDDYIYRYYQNNPRDNDYRQFRSGRWNDSDYQRWYRRNHRPDRSNRFSGNDAAAAAIFGLAVGGLLGGITGGALQGRPSAPAIIGNRSAPSAGGYQAFSSGYNRYCSNKYRSFDARSGTFLGYDGQRHYCQ